MSSYIYESLSALGELEKTTKFFRTEDGKSIRKDYPDITGYKTKVFTTTFIKVIDVAIIKNNKHFMTREQQTFFDNYCLEADSTFSEEMKQFDTFLGEYRGEDDG